MALSSTLSSTTVLPAVGERHKVELGLGAAGAAPSVQIVVGGRAYDRKAGVPALLANAIFPANQGYSSTAFNLSDQQRAQVDAGEKPLAYFHNAKRAEREIETFIKRKDIARVASVLDRVLDSLTAPTPVPAKK